MTIYETIGLYSTLQAYNGDLSPFEYVANVKPFKVPKTAEIAKYKQKRAPYVLSGKILPTNGVYKRNNKSLVYRDLCFLDYDDIQASAETFINDVYSVLKEYAYILYPTISSTPKSPRFRLVVQPSDNMDEQSYKATIQAIANRIPYPFDTSTLTWSQMQGLPVTYGEIEDYKRIINNGLPFPVVHAETTHNAKKWTYKGSYSKAGTSITVKITDTLLHGFGGDGERNVNATKFIGMLFNKYVNYDVNRAYELTMIANDATDPPLPISELDRTFESIARTELSKRF